MIHHYPSYTYSRYYDKHWEHISSLDNESTNNCPGKSSKTWYEKNGRDYAAEAPHFPCELGKVEDLDPEQSCNFQNASWETDLETQNLSSFELLNCTLGHVFILIALHPRNHSNIISNHLSTPCPVNFTPSNNIFLGCEKRKTSNPPAKKKKNTVHWSSRLLFTYTVTPIKQELNYCWSPWQSEPLAPVVSARLCSCLATCGTAAHWSVPNLREFRSLHRTSITW